MPLVDDVGAGPNAFGSTLDVSVNFGSDADRAILVEAFSQGDALGGTGIAINSVVIDPAGAAVSVPLSAEITSTSATVMNTVGRIRHGELAGATVPTGVKTVRLTLADGNARPMIRVRTHSGVTAVSAPVFAFNLSANISGTIASATGRQVDGILWAPIFPDAGSIVATSPTVASDRVLQSESFRMPGCALTEAGAASVTLEAQLRDAANAAYADNWGLVMWSLTPALPAQSQAPRSMHYFNQSKR